jgi:hypothetical protein
MTASVATRRAPAARTTPRPTPRSTGARATASRPARPPALRVVEPPRRRTPARAVAVVAGLVVFGSLLVSAMFHSVLVSGQAHIDDLGRQLGAERTALEQDRLRLAELSSPGRIAVEADRIGLVFAERQTWISPGSVHPPVVTGAEPDRAPADGSSTVVVGDTDERAGTGPGGTDTDLEEQR